MAAASSMQAAPSEMASTPKGTRMSPARLPITKAIVAGVTKLMLRS